MMTCQDKLLAIQAQTKWSLRQMATEMDVPRASLDALIRGLSMDIRSARNRRAIDKKYAEMFP